jgi:hypothetical protein
LASSGKRCTSSILAKLICKNVLYYWTEVISILVN